MVAGERAAWAAAWRGWPGQPRQRLGQARAAEAGAFRAQRPASPWECQAPQSPVAPPWGDAGAEVRHCFEGHFGRVLWGERDCRRLGRKQAERREHLLDRLHGQRGARLDQRAHALRPQKVSPSRSRRTLTSSREKMSSLCCEKLSAFVLTVKLSPAFPRISQLASLAWTPWQTRVEPHVPEGKTRTVRASTASSFPSITARTEVTPQGNKRLQSSAEVVDFTDRVESTVSCSSPRALDTVADGARQMQGAAESPDPTLLTKTVSEG